MKRFLGISIAFLGAVVIGKQIYDSFLGEDDKELFLGLEGELKKRLAFGERLSYSEANYASFASAIHSALENSVIADDKDMAERMLLQMNTTVDVLALILAHGSREYRIFGINDGPDKTLPQAISGGEFSESRLKRVNEAYKAKGIQFHF